MRQHLSCTLQVHPKSLKAASSYITNKLVAEAGPRSYMYLLLEMRSLIMCHGSLQCMRMMSHINYRMDVMHLELYANANRM